MKDSDYDPDKISELRKEMDNPTQKNIIKLLYDIYSVAKGMDNVPLAELLERELVQGYKGEVPVYRKFMLSGKQLAFREPLGKYKAVYKTKMFRSGTSVISISQIVDFIYQGIESQKEWLDFRTVLVRDSIKKKASELEQVAKRDVQKIDLSELKNEE